VLWKIFSPRALDSANVLIHNWAAVSDLSFNNMASFNICGWLFVGMIVAVGISSLQYVDMNSSRNLFIIGFSLFTGLAVPQWMSANKSAIKTGMKPISLFYDY